MALRKFQYWNNNNNKIVRCRRVDSVSARALRWAYLSIQYCLCRQTQRERERPQRSIKSDTYAERNGKWKGEKKTIFLFFLKDKTKLFIIGGRKKERETQGQRSAVHIPHEKKKEKGNFSGRQPGGWTTLIWSSFGGLFSTLTHVYMVYTCMYGVSFFSLPLVRPFIGITGTPFFFFFALLPPFEEEEEIPPHQQQTLRRRTSHKNRKHGRKK